MKRTFLAVLTLALCLALPFALAEETPAVSGLAAALNQAMQDEQDIKGFYEAALKAFPDARPFGTLLRSETGHIRLLERVAKDNGVLLQVTPGKPTVPATLEETLALAAQLEQADIDLYEGLLQDKTLPQGVIQAFQLLKNASERHLNALERAVQNNGPQGRYQGNGRLNDWMNDRQNDRPNGMLNGRPNGRMNGRDDGIDGDDFRQPRGGRSFRRNVSPPNPQMPGRHMWDRMREAPPRCPCQNCPRR